MKKSSHYDSTMYHPTESQGADDLNKSQSRDINRIRPVSVSSNASADVAATSLACRIPKTLAGTPCLNAIPIIREEVSFMKGSLRLRKYVL